MEAARAGNFDMAEAEAVMEAVLAVGRRLDKLANQEVQERLDEIDEATHKAIELALQLASVNSWIQDNEKTDEFGNNELDELTLDFTGLSADEAMSKLKVFPITRHRCSVKCTS